VADREERPDRSAPDGAYCSEHPDRAALATCPRCGSFACIVCWHGAVDRCHRCLLRNPTEAAPPIAWEDPERGPIRRFFGTIGSAFAPTRSAPAMARPDLGPALSFALLTAVPLALLEGIVPYTHTLGFGMGQVNVIGDPPPAPDVIVVDILRAMGLSLAGNVLRLIALGLPYLSLTRSYGASTPTAAGARVLLYRAWLLSLGPVLFSIFAWLSPDPRELPAAVLLVAQALPLVPWILFFLAMLSTARLACGVGPIVAILVVIIPFALMQVCALVLQPVVEPWLPDGARFMLPV
jgi:hypothetical protein